LGSFSALLLKFRDAFFYIFSLAKASRSFGTKKYRKRAPLWSGCGICAKMK
jgi:hypothetical protein